MSYPYYGAVPPKRRHEDEGGPRRFRFFSPTIIGLVCVGVVAGGVWMNRSVHSVMSSSTKASAKKGGLSPPTTSTIDFTLARSFYDPLPFFEDTYTSYLNYVFLKEYDAIVEPYQTMDLYFYGSTDISKANYIFQVCPEGGSASDCQEGYSYVSTDGKGTTKKGVQFECSTYSKYDMTLYSVDEDGNVLASQTGKALCLYVRRELRSLTKSDLSAYMDASYAVYSTPDEVGQKLYGEAFHNNTLIMRYHHINSAQMDSDHIHEGNGFMAQHVKLTNMFDDAVKVVDPSQSLPYWDFTIDNAEGRHPWEAIIMSAEMYGSMTLPYNLSVGFQYSRDKIDSGRIADGRWKDLKVETNWYYPDLNYGYGMLRGPWNMNPSEYITRFPFDFPNAIELPDCESHYSAFDFDDMMDFFYWNAFSPHSKTHTTFGGFFGCDKFYELVNEGVLYDETSALNVCSSWSFMVKEFWRRGYMTAKSGCEAADNVEDSYCGFECVDEHKDSMVSFVIPQFSDNINQTDLTKVRTSFKSFICDGSSGHFFTGDHLESASPADPSFWVIHPTMERLLHAKLMAGGFASESWVTDVYNDFVCEKPTCYNSTLDRTDYFEDCCYGHNENDRMFDPISGSRDVRVGPTNAETVAKTDPRSSSYSMPYIYDNFEWDHCVSQGYDFAALLDSMYAAAYDAKTGKLTPKKATKLTKEQVKVKARKQKMRERAELFKKFQEERDAKKAQQKVASAQEPPAPGPVDTSPEQKPSQQHGTKKQHGSGSGSSSPAKGH